MIWDGENPLPRYPATTDPVLSLFALCCGLPKMAVLHWGPGPHKLGCVYHQQGVCRFGGDAVIADVFVMPKIIKSRPIAITIGRYRKGTAIAKQKWHLADPRVLTGVSSKATEMFQAIGVHEGLAASLGRNVEELIARESDNWAQILASHSQRR